jgi:hypothetical protein
MLRFADMVVGHLKLVYRGPPIRKQTKVLRTKSSQPTTLPNRKVSS